MTTLNITKDQLIQLIPSNPYVDHWYDALEVCLPDYDINTPQRIAAFIAQCAHESNEFNTLKENLNYRWESLRRVFPKYFPSDDIARRYAHNQAAIANRVYGGRMGNGPESSGDGWRYCGRGLIQLTGKNNYQAFANSIDTPLNEIPEFLATFEGAVQSACWFWEKNNLNALADKGNIIRISEIINGGHNGLEDRINRYKHALEILTT